MYIFNMKNCIEILAAHKILRLTMSLCLLKSLLISINKVLGAGLHISWGLHMVYIYKYIYIHILAVSVCTLVLNATTNRCKQLGTIYLPHSWQQEASKCFCFS